MTREMVLLCWRELYDQVSGAYNSLYSDFEKVEKENECLKDQIKEIEFALHKKGLKIKTELDK